MIERYCLKCKVIIYHDHTEKQWVCDCTIVDIDLDEDFLPEIVWEPDYWINLSIPKSIAVCPKCGAGLTIEDVDEWDGETGIATETGFHITCNTAPAIDSDGWRGWFSWHYSTPYIDWLPIQDTVYQWFVGQHKEGEK